MTKYHGESRDIDNSRLFGLRSGRLFVTPLREFVSWEGFGERALLILNERRSGIKTIASQPKPKRLVQVGGKLVRYTADFEFTFTCSTTGRHFIEVWEAKNSKALADERWKEKLAAVEAQVSAEGKRFRVLDSTWACYSMKLRTAEVLRLYRLVAVTPEVERWLLDVVRERPTPLGELAQLAEAEGLGRQQIYAAIYLRILTVDESLRLNDQSLVALGEGRLWPDIASRRL